MSVESMKKLPPSDGERLQMLEDKVAVMQVDLDKRNIELNQLMEKVQALQLLTRQIRDSVITCEYESD